MIGYIHSLSLDKDTNMSAKILKFTLLALLFTNLFIHNALAQTKEIALTIDDLPFVGTNSATKGNLGRAHDRFNNILDYLVDAHIPATGFIIANSIASGQWALLESFRDAGFALGNHTYSHANLNSMSSERYIDEIAKADKILARVMTQPKYFRYPYLAEGRGATKHAVQNYLVANQYTIAPVTIDSKDYQFNERLLHIPWRVREQYVSKIKQQYLSYVWKQTLIAEKHAKEGSGAQILLIHANLLNSHCLGDLIKMYKDNGYQFVTLEQALSHHATPATGEIDDQKVSFNQLDAIWLRLQGYPIQMKVGKL
jgi:peptidoglycan/xylan/chitin deacetylase (PgdA/CDA1 family)